MSTFLFTWNPRRFQWYDLPSAIEELNACESWRDNWSCAAFKKVAEGDRFFLMRLGKHPKGLIGSGQIVSGDLRKEHWDPERRRQGKIEHCVDIEFDVLSQDPVLDESEFKTGILSKYHWYPEASGQIIPEEIAAELERMWAEKVGLNFIPSESRRQFIEGRKTRAEVTRIERNPDARRECIKQHGLACTVCNFEFVKEYGRVGRDFIIVHHLDPTSLRSGKHKVDPVKDLRPVCPNCHAMIHQRTPPFSIAEIKEMLKS